MDSIEFGTELTVKQDLHVLPATDNEIQIHFLKGEKVTVKNVVLEIFHGRRPQSPDAIFFLPQICVEHKDGRTRWTDGPDIEKEYILD